MQNSTISSLVALGDASILNEKNRNIDSSGVLAGKTAAIQTRPVLTYEIRRKLTDS